MGFVQPLAAPARTRSATALPLADGPPTPLGRAGQQATDRRGTARSSERSAYQSQPRHTVGRRDLGSAHRAATQSPVNPATTGKTEKRVLTPFLFPRSDCPAGREAIQQSGFNDLDPQGAGRA
jgi:hypothetical protein